MRRSQFGRRLARFKMNDNSDLLVVRLNEPRVDLALRPRLVLLVVLAAGHRAVWGCPLWSRLLARLAGAAVASGSEERLFRLRRPLRLPSAHAGRARPKWQVPSTKCSSNDRRATRPATASAALGVIVRPVGPLPKSGIPGNPSKEPGAFDFLCGACTLWCRPRAAFLHKPRRGRSPLTRWRGSTAKNQRSEAACRAILKAAEKG